MSAKFAPYYVNEMTYKKLSGNVKVRVSNFS